MLARADELKGVPVSLSATKTERFRLPGDWTMTEPRYIRCANGAASLVAELVVALGGFVRKGLMQPVTRRRRQPRAGKGGRGRDYRGSVKFQLRQGDAPLPDGDILDRPNSPTRGERHQLAPCDFPAISAAGGSTAVPRLSSIPGCPIHP